MLYAFTINIELSYSHFTYNLYMLKLFLGYNNIVIMVTIVQKILAKTLFLKISSHFLFPI